MKIKSKVHFTDSYFHALPHRVTINLIGCGGTGSFIMGALARLDYALKELNMPGIHVNAFDNDIVQKHNVGRQNFTPFDIGQYKSTCLTEKINMAFGLQWHAYVQHVDDIGKIMPANVYITAVDNVKTRTMVHKHFSKKNPLVHHEPRNDFKKPFYWIDAGNGKDFGQVILATIKNIKQPKSKIYETVNFLPDIIDRYGDLSKFDNVKDQGMESCSMAESLAKQDLYINNLVSIYVADILWKLIKDLKIDYSGVIINQATFATRPLGL